MSLITFASALLARGGLLMLLSPHAYRSWNLSVRIQRAVTSLGRGEFAATSALLLPHTGDLFSLPWLLGFAARATFILALRLAFAFLAGGIFFHMPNTFPLTVFHTTALRAPCYGGTCHSHTKATSTTEALTQHPTWLCLGGGLWGIGYWYGARCMKIMMHLFNLAIIDEKQRQEWHLECTVPCWKKYFYHCPLYILY